jgi:hypothetical protein
MDPAVTAAFWIAGRACYRVMGGLPIVELKLGPDAFDAARRDIGTAIAARDSVEPPDDKRVTELLIGAESARYAGELSDNWMCILTDLVGTPWKEHLFPRAREAVRQRFNRVELVAAELLFEKFVLVSRVVELCGVRDFMS